MKKSVSFAAASALVCASIGTLTSHAFAYQTYPDEINSMIEGYTELESYDAFVSKYDLEHSRYLGFYINEEGGIIIVGHRTPTSISFGIPDDLSEEWRGEMQDIISSVCPDAKITVKSNACTVVSHTQVYIDDEEYEELKITAAKAEKIFRALNDKGIVCREFVYNGEAIALQKGSCPDLSHYYISNSNFEKLEKYISENTFDGVSGISINVKESSGGYTTAELAVQGDISFHERCELANLIARNTEARPLWVYSNNSENIGTGNIEMLNALSGDSNCDGSVNLADAVFIMQSLANPSKYVLSAQGSFNGDVEGDDGITAKDALAIQKQLLGS